MTEYRGDNLPPRPQLPPSTVSGEHKYRWLFNAPPVSGPEGEQVPFSVPVEFADDLGKHLERNSLWTRAELIEIAQQYGGTLHPEVLPEPTIRHDPPPSGPETWINPGPWVPMGAPVKPRPEDLSDEQAQALRDSIAEAERLLDEREARRKDQS